MEPKAETKHLTPGPLEEAGNDVPRYLFLIGFWGISTGESCCYEVLMLGYLPP
jgi:hypothetical protein